MLVQPGFRLGGAWTKATLRNNSNTTSGSSLVLIILAPLAVTSGDNLALESQVMTNNETLMMKADLP